MNKLKKLIVVGVLALLTSVAVSRKSNATEWTADFRNTFATKYVDNGILKGNHVVARPRLEFEKALVNGDLSFSAVANLDFRDEEINRLDLGVNYSFDYGDNTIEVEYKRKTSKKGDAWKGLDVLLGRATAYTPFRHSLEVEFSVEEGSYFGLSAEKPIHLPDNQCNGKILTAGAELGYNVHAFRKEAGFSHFGTYLSYPLTMPREGFLSKFDGELRARYSVPLADDIGRHWVVEFNLGKGL